MTPKATPAERAAARAREARGYAEAKGEQPASAPTAPTEAGQPGPQPLREWWRVFKPGAGASAEVFVYPPQTQRDMTSIVYPGCGCVPREAIL